MFPKTSYVLAYPGVGLTCFNVFTDIIEVLLRKSRKKQKQNEEAKRNQGSLLRFLKPRDKDHPSSSGHEEDGTSTSVSARDDIQDPVAEETESLTPCSADNDSIASAEDDDPPTTVCGLEEPLEGCQLTDLRKTYNTTGQIGKLLRN